MLYVEVGLYHGGQLLLPVLRTGEVATASSHPRWNQWLKFNIRVKNLPKVCVCVRACVRVCVYVCVHVSMLLPALHQAARMHICVLGRGHKEKKKSSRRNTISNVHDIDPDTCAGDEVLLWVNVQVVDHR